MLRDEFINADNNDNGNQFCTHINTIRAIGMYKRDHSESNGFLERHLDNNI